MACGPQYEIINNIDRTLTQLRRLGIGPGDEVYNLLYQARGAAFGSIGYKVPRSVLQVLRLIALSPGELRVFFDVETGWLAEIRDRPGAPPRYRSIDTETAAKAIKGELTHDDFSALAVPDDYIGE